MRVRWMIGADVPDRVDSRNYILSALRKMDIREDGEG